MTLLVEHDPLRKPVSTFRDHALAQNFAAGVFDRRQRATGSPTLRGRDARALRAARDQTIDVVNAEAEDEAVDEHEQREAESDTGSRYRRNGIGGAQNPIGDPRLTAGLGDDPAADHGNEADPPSPRQQ